MAENRLFTNEELNNFSKGFIDLALEALEKGDIETAKHWCKRNEEAKCLFHDFYLHWVTLLFSKIYELWGEDAAESMLKETTRISCAPVLSETWETRKTKGMREYIISFLDMWRHHCGAFKVEEDNEKIILILEPCGSGGKLIDMKAYEEPLGYARLKKEGPHTWGEKNVPIYCAHCPWINEIWPIHLYGKGAQLCINASPFPKKSGDPCVLYIYKDPKMIPEKYYKRIQMDNQEE